jgi:FkbM family methyltransferase
VAESRYRTVTAPWGARLTVDVTDRSHRAGFVDTGVSWPHEIRVLEGLITPGMTVVDVGAAFGYLTSLAAVRVGPTGRVIACEPAPAAYRLLADNVAANGWIHVTCEPQALSDSAGIADLYLDAHNLACHSLELTNVLTPGAATPVLTATLDQVLARLDVDHVDVLKLDVEGWEARVLSGARASLPAVRHIWLEFWPDGLRRAGSDPAAILAGLVADGYALRLVDLVTGDDRPAVTAADVLAYCEGLAGSAQLRDDPDPLYALVYVLASRGT